MLKHPLHVFNFSIKNTSDDSVDIHIDGDIVDASTQELLKSWFGDTTSVSFKSFRQQIDKHDVQTYNIYVNTNGGLVTDAMAMHDFLEELETKGKNVNRIGRGIIASAGTYVLMGKGSKMTKNSWFMIHNVSGGIWGDVNVIENYAATLRKFNNRVRDFYAEVTGKRKEEITKMMDAETWMAADEAKDNGFVTNVVGAEDFTNAIAKENWPYSNTSVLTAYNSAVKVPPIATDPTQIINKNFDDMKKFFENLGQKIMNAVKGVKAPENNDHSALVTSIGEAIQNVFTEAGTELETEVGNVVNTAIASKPVNDAIAVVVKNAVDAATNFSAEGPAKVAFDAAVKAAVENATKDLTGKVTSLETARTALETKNKALEQELTNLVGKPSNSSEKGNEEVKPIGSYVE